MMGYSVEEDQKATRILAEYLIKGNVIDPCRILDLMIRNRNVLVFGAGPSLSKGINEILRSRVYSDCVLIAADGATKALIEKGLNPDIIVTDLDGDMDAILKSIGGGAIPAIHGHGDNIDKLNRYMNKILSLNRYVLGTTQVEPIPPVKNFGGFTDGDRAVFLASHFKAKNIIMVGMDFGEIVGKYSKPYLLSDEKASDVKRKKLNFAYELISWLATKKNTPKIYTLSEITPKGVIKISSMQIKEIVV